MISIKHISLLLTASIMISGCFNSSTGPLANIDQPLLLGKVSKIGGEMKQMGNKKDEFDLFNTRATPQSGFGPCEIGLEKCRINITADALKQKIAHPDDLIKVDTIYYRSGYILILIPYANVGFGVLGSTTGIKGAIFENKQ